MTTATNEARVESTAKWIRGYRNGLVVVDSRAVQLVWTHRSYPTWFFPRDDVDSALLSDGAVVVSTHPDLPDHVAIGWADVDRWFEEDVEVFVHPRSPYARIDALASSRHVVVTIDGTVVADSHRPTILYETGLAPRYYLPPADVRLDLLTPTDNATACPYKGFATYWTVTIDATEHVDIAWSYPTPLPESFAIAGLVCFYDHRVELTVT